MAAHFLRFYKLLECVSDIFVLLMFIFWLQQYNLLSISLISNGITTIITAHLLIIFQGSVFIWIWKATSHALLVLTLQACRNMRYILQLYTPEDIIRVVLYFYSSIFIMFVHWIDIFVAINKFILPLFNEISKVVC